VLALTSKFALSALSCHLRCISTCGISPKTDATYSGRQILELNMRMGEPRDRKASLSLIRQLICVLVKCTGELSTHRVCEKSATSTGSADVSSAPASVRVGQPSPQGRCVAARQALIPLDSGADETFALPVSAGTGETPAVPGLFTDPVSTPLRTCTWYYIVDILSSSSIAQFFHVAPLVIQLLSTTSHAIILCQHSRSKRYHIGRLIQVWLNRWT